MKSASVVQLLKIGRFLFQQQYLIKKISGVKYDFFKDEMNALLQMILIYMGIVRGKDNFIYIINTDHYEYITMMFWRFCKGEIYEEEMIDHIHILKMDEVQIIEVNGQIVKNSFPTDSMHVLYELKNLLYLKRIKLNKFIHGLTDFIKAELKQIHIVLEKLDRN
ncbi:hypothetical protein ACFSO7_13620 [Bacillus sp. CGMCC 1.16607]|uniref:hypothetical protein n=1 Tax=Bacillus sp. CGMCC 1.16607 TaxID=3351842 RepID=UPI00362F9F42